MAKEILEYTCEQCGHSWIAKKPSYECEKCGSVFLEVEKFKN